jgi:hypothetical protein
MDPFTWIALALLAGGTYSQYRNTKEAQQNTQKAIAQAQARQSELNREMQGRTVDFATETYDPETRSVNEEQAAQDATSSLLSEVLASRDRGMGETSDAQGEVSGDYTTDRAKMVAKTLDRASTLAHLMGRARGATDLRFNEGIGTARLGGDIADLSSLGKSRASADSGLIQLAGQIDPGKAALASLMQGVGTTYLAGNLGTGGGGGATSGTWSGTTPTLQPGQWNSLTPTKAVAKGWFV